MRRSSISRRGKRWLVFSTSAASATVSSRSRGSVMPLSQLSKDPGGLAAGSHSGFGKRGVPPLPVGDDMQQSLGARHVVGVAGGDGLPGVAGRVSCRNAERGQEPVAAVGPMVGERLAGPLAGDQDAPPGVAEVFAAVRFALAVSWSQACAGVLGLDAVAQPVRACRGARLVAERVGQPLGMRVLRVGLGRWQSATCLVRYLVR